MFRCIGETSLEEMRDCLREMAKNLKAGSRVRLFLDKNSATKMSVYIKMSGHLGALMIQRAQCGANPMPDDQANAIIGLLHAIGDMWCKTVKRCVSRKFFNLTAQRTGPYYSERTSLTKPILARI